MSVTYLHLPPCSEPPPIDAIRPFKAVLVLDQAVPDQWQRRVSEWLVSSGCLYMMAWGTGCSSWDDSVDYASILAKDYNDVPEDEFVMTTWHDNQSLSETFWFASHNAFHRTVTLSNVLIIDVGTADRETLLLDMYFAAENAPA